MAPKQTQTSEVTLDTPEARVLSRFQSQALQVQAQVQPQSQSSVSPADVQAPERPRKAVQTQTSELVLVPEQVQRWEEMEPGVYAGAGAEVGTDPSLSVQVQIGDAQPAEQQPQEQTQVPLAEDAPAPGHSEGLHRSSGTIEAEGTYTGEATKVQP